MLQIDRHIQLGYAGELFAKDWFKEHAYKIVVQNWRTTAGEIDLIVEKNDTLVFIEVKTLPHTVLTDLDIIIGKKKRERICRAAKCFLAAHRDYDKMHIRFDVFVLPFDPRKTVSIMPLHFENAFEDDV